MHKSRNEKIGELASIGHLVFDGFWPVGAAYGTQVLGIPPVELLGLATFVSSLFFLGLTLHQKQFKQLLSWRILTGCALYTACLLLPYAAIFYAAKSSGAINTALFTQSEVIFAALIGWLFLKEKIQSFRVMGILCILFANLLVLYSGDISIQPVALILIFAPAVFVFGNIVSVRSQSRGLGYAPLLLFRGSVGGLSLLLLSSLVENFAMPAPSTWWFLISFGLFCFGIPKALWQIALTKMDLSKTTAMGMSYPAFSFIFAYFLLAEIPTIYQFCGLGISFLGIYFLMKSTSKQVVEPLAHTN